MFPASTNGGGTTMAVPDVCKTPTPVGPIPIPYPSNSMLLQAVLPTCSLRVMILAKNVCLQSTQIMMTQGMEAGAAGGVASGIIKGPASFKLGSLKVKIEGQSPVYTPTVVGHNGASPNHPAGTQVAPSQTKVFVSP